MGGCSTGPDAGSRDKCHFATADHQCEAGVSLQQMRHPSEKGWLEDRSFLVSCRTQIVHLDFAAKFFVVAGAWLVRSLKKGSDKKTKSKLTCLVASSSGHFVAKRVE